MISRLTRLSRAALPAALVLSGLAACGGVEVGADMEFPRPLVEPLPLKLGVYYSDEYKNFQHAEERWGSEWKVELGKYHVAMTDKLFDAAFRDVVALKAPAEGQTSDVRAVIEPRIEQYSFITPRDTGAKYYAVTIKYRLNVFAPDGRLADTLSFTGYGSAPSTGMTSTKPMLLATRKAMRDAAAKFLVQFPEQDVVKKLIAGLPLTPAGSQSAETGGDLETVPIIDPQATAQRKPGSPNEKPSGQGGTPPPLLPPGETKDQPPPAGSPPSGSDKPPAPQPPPETTGENPPASPGDENPASDDESPGQTDPPT